MYHKVVPVAYAIDVVPWNNTSGLVLFDGYCGMVHCGSSKVLANNLRAVLICLKLWFI